METEFVLKFTDRKILFKKEAVSPIIVRIRKFLGFVPKPKNLDVSFLNSARVGIYGYKNKSFIFGICEVYLDTTQLHCEIAKEDFESGLNDILMHEALHVAFQEIGADFNTEKNIDQFTELFIKENG